MVAGCGCGRPAYNARRSAHNVVIVRVDGAGALMDEPAVAHEGSASWCGVCLEIARIQVRGISTGGASGIR